MKKTFTIPEKELQELISASRPMPLMTFGGLDSWEVQALQKRDIWERLSKKLGFKHGTEHPVEGGAYNEFTAEIEKEIKK